MHAVDRADVCACGVRVQATLPVAPWVNSENGRRLFVVPTLVSPAWATVAPQQTRCPKCNPYGRALSRCGVGGPAW